MKIDFTKFPLYTSLSHDIAEAVDVSKSLSDILYTRASGIAPHVLSEKIYRSNGEIELEDNEIEIIKECYSILTPAFQDSFNNLINSKK